MLPAEVQLQVQTLELLPQQLADVLKSRQLVRESAGYRSHVMHEPHLRTKGLQLEAANEPNSCHSESVTGTRRQLQSCAASACISLRPAL